jgi:hypothetical protein
MILAASCSEGEETEQQNSPTDSDPVAFLERARSTMAGLDSYRQELSLSPEGPAISFQIDYSKPDSYYERLLESPGDANFELIQKDGSLYVRHCRDIPNDCEEWEQSEANEYANVPSLGGLTGVAPETLGITSLDLVTDIARVEEISLGGERVIQLNGAIDLNQLFFKNLLRVTGAAGELLEACSESSTVIIGTDGTREASGPTTMCKTLAYADWLREQNDGADPPDTPPSTIRLWISPDDALVRQIVITVPGRDKDAYLETKYSRFNDVTIEAPEDAVPAD